MAGGGGTSDAYDRINNRPSSRNIMSRKNGRNRKATNGLSNPTSSSENVANANKNSSSAN